jgi:hypothetical protein
MKQSFFGSGIFVAVSVARNCAIVADVSEMLDASLVSII